MRPLNTGLNTDALKLTAERAALVTIPVPLLNMAEPYIFILAITLGCSMYRQGTPKHGIWNLTEGLPWNVPTNVRKKTIN